MGDGGWHRGCHSRMSRTRWAPPPHHSALGLESHLLFRISRPLCYRRRRSRVSTRPCHLGEHICLDANKSSLSKRAPARCKTREKRWFELQTPTPSTPAPCSCRSDIKSYGTASWWERTALKRLNSLYLKVRAASEAVFRPFNHLKRLSIQHLEMYNSRAMQIPSGCAPCKLCHQHARRGERVRHVAQQCRSHGARPILPGHVRGEERVQSVVLSCFGASRTCPHRAPLAHPKHSSKKAARCRAERCTRSCCRSQHRRHCGGLAPPTLGVLLPAKSPHLPRSSTARMAQTVACLPVGLQSPSPPWCSRHRRVSSLFLTVAACDSWTRASAYRAR